MSRLYPHQDIPRGSPAAALSLGVFLLLPVAASPGPALAPAARFDSRLVTAIAVAPDDTLSVWVTFADKGEAGPRDLAARLAAAEATLEPRARARRLRAGVHPLADYLDLPVHAPYVTALAARGLTAYGASRWFNRVAVRVPGRDLEALAALPFVARLSKVERMRRSPEPEPTGRDVRAPAHAHATRLDAVDYGMTFSQLSQIEVPALHDSGYTGAGVLVAVLDEGFNWFTKHEALRDVPIPPERQRDFFRGVNDVQDTTNFTMIHGTWVLGCLAGRKFGTYVGAAYGADYALARTEVRVTETPQEMVYWGMGAEWADSLGADIISSSLGYSTFDDPYPDYTYADMNGHTTVVSRAAEIAASKGILVVNAVGNEGTTSWHYLVAPSDVNGDSVLAVGAVDGAGVPAAFSSYGPSASGHVKPDLAALGVSNPLVSTSGDPQAYTALSGTSFATPLVAGLAACLMQARPGWAPCAIAGVLHLTASRAGAPDDRMGYGIANGAAALRWDNRPGTAPPGALRLELAGANPVAFGRAPARFRVGLGGASTAGGTPRPGTLRVFDAQGRRVRELWSGMLPCLLPVTIVWDGLGRDGRGCGPGLYVVELRAGSDRAALRVVCLR